MDLPDHSSIMTREFHMIKTIFNESVEGGMHMDIDDGVDEGNVSGNVGF